jgi:hypothetical protein
MTGVTIDLKLRNFVEAEQFFEKLPDELLSTFRKTMSDWYYRAFIPNLQEVIVSGISDKFPYRNRSERWARYKNARWGVNHSLGRLSGRLHDEVVRAHPTFTRTGFRTEMKVSFNQPFYLRYLEGRGKYHYPPIATAKRNTQARLITFLQRDLENYIRQKGGK